jgi:hypothetical protein
MSFILYFQRCLLNLFSLFSLLADRQATAFSEHANIKTPSVTLSSIKSSESGSDMDSNEDNEFMWESEDEFESSSVDEHLRIADAEFSDEEDEVLFGQDNSAVYFTRLLRVKHNDPFGSDYLHLEYGELGLELDYFLATIPS